MAENGLDEPVIGVTFDGTGYGTDGAIWGGEFLVGDYREFRRAAHLRYVGMPGGDRAIREPWRMAVAHLRDAGAEFDVAARHAFRRDRCAIVQKMLERRFNTPLHFERGPALRRRRRPGRRPRPRQLRRQAAIELEWLATGVPPDGAYPVRARAAAPGGGRPRWSSTPGR